MKTTLLVIKQMELYNLFPGQILEVGRERKSPWNQIENSELPSLYPNQTELKLT